MYGYRPPPYALACTVQPTEEPLALSDVKDWLRVDQAFTDDDNKITGLITAARIVGERVSGRRFCVATWRMTLDRFPPIPIRGLRHSGGYGEGYGWPEFGYLGIGPHWPAIRLQGSPVSSVVSVQYYDVSETQQTLDPSTYQFSADYRPALLVVRFPPPTYPRPDAVQITYVAGQAAATLEQSVKVALMMAVAQWYYQAGDSDESGVPLEPMPARALGMLLGESDGERSYGR